MAKPLNIIILLLLITIIVVVSGCSSTNKPINNTAAPTLTPETTPVTTPTTNTTTPELTNTSQTTEQYQTYYVNITRYAFVPVLLNVSVGDTVIWTDRDNIKYEIRGNKFNSPVLNQGSTFSYTFTEQGDYPYIDPAYSGMRGIITVSPLPNNQSYVAPSSNSSNNTIELRPEVSYGSNQSIAQQHNDNIPTQSNSGGKLRIIPANTSNTIIVNNSTQVGNPQRDIVLAQNRTNTDNVIVATHDYTSS